MKTKTITVFRTVTAVVFVLTVVAALASACGPQQPEPTTLMECVQVGYSTRRCVDAEAGVACWMYNHRGISCLPLGETDLEGWRE